MACLHDHSCEDHDCSSDWSLYKHIDLSKVSALNEATPGSVKSVFKAWEERLNSSGDHLESNEGDPELLVFITFTSDVKIKSISIVGGADGTSPNRMRVLFLDKHLLCRPFPPSSMLFNAHANDNMVHQSRRHGLFRCTKHACHSGMVSFKTFEELIDKSTPQLE